MPPWPTRTFIKPNTHYSTLLWPPNDLKIALMPVGKHGGRHCLRVCGQMQLRVMMGDTLDPLSGGHDMDAV